MAAIQDPELLCQEEEINQTHSSITADKHESLPFIIDPLEIDPIRFSYFGVLSAAKEGKEEAHKSDPPHNESAEDIKSKEETAKTTVLLDPVVSRNRFTLQPLRSIGKPLAVSEQIHDLDSKASQRSWLNTDNAEGQHDQVEDAGLEEKVAEAAKLMYLDNYSHSSLKRFTTIRPDSDTVAVLDNNNSYLHDDDDDDDDNNDESGTDSDEESEFEVCIAAVAAMPTPDGSIIHKTKTIDEESFIEASDSNTSSQFETLVAEDTRPPSAAIEQPLDVPSIEEIPITSHLSPPPRKSPVVLQVPLPPRSPFRDGVAELEAVKVVDTIPEEPSDFQKEIARAAELERLRDEQEAAFRQKERDDEEKWLQELHKAQAEAAMERERESRAAAETAKLAMEELSTRKESIEAAKKVSSTRPSPRSTLKVPRHPIISMQDAFAESMLEAAEPPSVDKGHSVPKHPQERREMLLSETTEVTHVSKWKPKPGERCHELWKLIAQISFGSYLLFDGMARSDTEVLQLLQGHITEIDEFVYMTLQDFDLAMVEITERLTCLKIPMENMLAFDQMLLDRDFRISIVVANEKVDHVITRSTSAMNHALKDVQQGLSATKEFVQWLKTVAKTPKWLPDRPDIQKVYNGMRGNAEGWHKALTSLQTKGKNLGIALVQLGSIVAEMDRRVVDIERKTEHSVESKRSSSMNGPASPPLSPLGINVSHFSKSSTETSLDSTQSLAQNLAMQTLPPFNYAADRNTTPPAEEDCKIPVLEQEIILEPTVFTLQPRVYSPALNSPTKTLKITKDAVVDNMAIPDKAQRLLIGRNTSGQSIAHSNKPASLRQHSEPTTSMRLTLPKTLEKSNRLSSRLRNVSDSRPVSSAQAPQTCHPSPNVNAAALPPQSGNYSISGIEMVTQPSSQPMGLTSSATNASMISTTPRVVDIAFFPAPPSISTSRPGSPYISSPKSDQQHFRPVMANPNSPLQRPWTAGPTQQHQDNGYFGPHSSSPYTNQQQQQQQQANIHRSTSRGPSRVPSPMNQPSMAPPPPRSYAGPNLTVHQFHNAHAANNSIHSYTSATSDRETQDGDKKVKKKKSGFGWLKKAFSLSEEEKAEFEERKRRAVEGNGRVHGDAYSTRTGYGGYADSVYERQAPRFLDGRRIR